MLKFAYSTLACPSWTFDEILAAAKDFGYDGIEIRGIENEVYVPKTKAFSRDLQDSMKRLKALGLTVPMLSSASVIGDQANQTTEMANAKEYIELAEEAEIDFVRVLVEPSANPSQEPDLALAAKNLLALSEYARTHKTKVLIETNGYLANSKRMAEFMKPIANDSLGIIWDVHHPFRFFNENVEETYQNLRPYISYLHMKDSKMVDGKLRYQMMGYGDVPNQRSLELLSKDGFDGFVSLEWVKRWNVELEEPSLVIPNFIGYVRGVLARMMF